MLPLPMQDSLPAGWLAFTGWELNPLGRNERFPRCYIFFPFPGFILTLREFIELGGVAATSIIFPPGVNAQHGAASAGPAIAGGRSIADRGVFCGEKVR